MSYGDDTGFATWLTTYGYTLPGGSPAPAVLRARGSTYLDAIYGAVWSGVPTDPLVQENAWPRIGATINCTTVIADNITPLPVVNASYMAAYLEAVTPGILSGGATGGPRVKRQKVDVIEREFFDDGAATAGNGGGFIDPAIDGLMKQFICADDGGFFFTSIGS